MATSSMVGTVEETKEFTDDEKRYLIGFCTVRKNRITDLLNRAGVLNKEDRSPLEGELSMLASIQKKVLSQG